MRVSITRVAEAKVSSGAKSGLILLAILAGCFTDNAQKYIDRVSCPDGAIRKHDETWKTIHVWCEDQAGLVHGPDMSWFSGGQQAMEAHYGHGLAEGTSRYWFQGGRLSNEYMAKHGIPSGIDRVWYENGNLYEWSMWFNRTHVLSVQWNEDGSLQVISHGGGTIGDSEEDQPRPKRYLREKKR